MKKILLIFLCAAVLASSAACFVKDMKTPSGNVPAEEQTNSDTKGDKAKEDKNTAEPAEKRGCRSRDTRDEGTGAEIFKSRAANIAPQGQNGIC